MRCADRKLPNAKPQRHEQISGEMSGSARLFLPARVFLWARKCKLPALQQLAYSLLPSSGLLTPHCLFTHFLSSACFLARLHIHTTPTPTNRTKYEKRRRTFVSFSTCYSSSLSPLLFLVQFSFAFPFLLFAFPKPFAFVFSTTLLHP